MSFLDLPEGALKKNVDETIEELIKNDKIGVGGFLLRPALVRAIEGFKRHHPESDFKWISVKPISYESMDIIFKGNDNKEIYEHNERRNDW